MAVSVSLVTQAVTSYVSAKSSGALAAAEFAGSTKARQMALAGQSDWGKEGDYSPSFKLTPQDSGSFKLEGNTTFDIVNKFRWTYSNFREETPRILLVERQLTANQQLAYYNPAGGQFVNNLFAGPGEDPYQKLYSIAEKTGFEYILPYYSNNNISVGSTWSDTPPAAAESLGMQLAEGAAQGVAGTVSGFLASGAERLTKAGSRTGNKKFIAMAAGANMLNSVTPTGIYDAYNKAIRIKGALNEGSYTGVETPMYFNNTAKSSFNITFPLFNTTSTEDIRRNYDFIRVFGYQNSYDRKTFSTYNPPVIYECKFANGYMGEIGERPAMHVSNFSVSNVGAIKSIDIGIGTKLAVPEAYVINITLQEMLAMSRSIFSSFFTGGSIVNVY